MLWAKAIDQMSSVAAPARAARAIVFKCIYIKKRNAIWRPRRGSRPATHHLSPNTITANFYPNISILNATCESSDVGRHQCS